MGNIGKVLTFGLGSSLFSNNDAKNAGQAQEQATNATNAAIAEQQAKNDAATQSLKDSQANASAQAQATLKRKSAGYSQTVYTSPLGLSGQASTAKKMLLGQ